MIDITFIIPVVHPDNCKNWDELVSRLRQTLTSISAQSHGEWRGIVVANEGAHLPEMPRNFLVERVSFPPNPKYNMSVVDREMAYDAVRLDKGRRILAGLLAAGESSFFMTVDDDDFISCRIAGYVSENRKSNGWRIDKGYIWSEGGRLLKKHDDFSNYCGSSLIIRSDLLSIPMSFSDATSDYIKTMLGSHVQIAKILESRGTPLGSVPFRGAIYRVGHRGAHSLSKPLWRSAIKKSMLKHPEQIFRTFAEFQWLTPEIRKTFFGDVVG